ncbi:hypothetical protein [Caballeronia sp. TF1N1]|uniref:hypothetical protein n=1 Tax=Caballeronia sp. TF1N1 TaxID=2878153 RepID=UPI001FD22CD5|nr:hypothetical protein [Caballeronia sp. TF1N1]
MQIKQNYRQVSVIPQSSKRPKRLSLVAALGISTLLSACGGSPSEADVRAALSKQVDEGRAQAEQIMGKSSFLDQRLTEQKQAVAAVKLIGCKADGEKAYLCDVEGKAGATRVRMLKGSDGWIAADPQKG